MDFEEIYQAYFHDVYFYMISLASDENIAEEITQETFFKALKSMHQFDGKKDEYTPRDSFPFELYVTEPPKNFKAKSKTDIYVPIE
ncbi:MULTISPECIES: sigma factor [Lysinibacillus]|uniref:RNA polymerase sigma factor n=1 Tax=Lysinibacillus TaxID=400634 RepID=UPI0006AF76A1|nr:MULTISPECIES: sigma factor [Lysinibacillus]